MEDGPVGWLAETMFDQIKKMWGYGALLTHCAKIKDNYSDLTIRGPLINMV